MSHSHSRRDLLKMLLAGLGTMSATSLLGGEDVESGGVVSSTGQHHPALEPFDELMTQFIQLNHVPGGALAVSRNSDLVYSRGFGLADPETKRPVKPDSLFRIASISKPITAVAVLQLVEKSSFGLEDKVFDILSAANWLPARHDERLRSITVAHLLQHRAGWDRDETFDPIGRPRKIAEYLNKRLPVGASDVVHYTLTLPLSFDPGERYAYSNVGYLLLGRLIEHVSGEPYETYVKQHVLAPLGIKTMHLGRAWRDDLSHDEVHYFDSQNRKGTAICGSKIGEEVPLVYGAENIEGYEAHGGWVASAPDLVRFASDFDDPNTSKLLKPETIAQMWSRPEGRAGHDSSGKPLDSYYGYGWSVRPVGAQGMNVWHNGLIAGTSTILVRRHDGLNWAVLFNTEANPTGKALSDLIDGKVHQAANAVRKWPIG